VNYDDEQMGSLVDLPKWINAALLKKRMETWPVWCHTAWMAGILRARGEHDLAQIFTQNARNAQLVAAYRETPSAVLFALHWRNPGQA
jgi:hypothetical protein